MASNTLFRSEMGCAANFDKECSEGINTNDYNIRGQVVMGEKDCSKQSIKEEMKLGLQYS